MCSSEICIGECEPAIACATIDLLCGTKPLCTHWSGWHCVAASHCAQGENRPGWQLCSRGDRAGVALWGVVGVSVCVCCVCVCLWVWERERELVWGEVSHGLVNGVSAWLQR